MILRPYQSAAVDAVADWHRTRPGDAGLVVIPTGGGKTAVMAGLVRQLREADASARTLILAHMSELLSQAQATAFKIMPAYDVGIYSAGQGRKDTRQPLIVAGVQSLRSNPYVLAEHKRPIDRVLVDEAHLISEKKDTGFRKVLDGLKACNPNVQIVGLTATPYRMKSGLIYEGDDRTFDGVAYEATIPDLLAQGYLCPLRPKATTTRLSTAGVEVRGDYVPSQLAAAVDVDKTTAAIAAECVAAFADRVSWLVFGVSLKHCEHMASAIAAYGISTQVIHGDMTPKDRAAAIAAHKSGAVRCAVSCDLLTIGYDHPAIDAIAMCRPTKSPGLWYQACGRGFRIAPGKADCLVLDFAGNTLQHGPLDTLSDRIASRRKGAGDGVAPAKECPDCQALVAAGCAECACGHVFPPPAPPALTTVPSERPLLSIDVPEPLWESLTDVQFSVTAPTDPAKRPTLRVDYMRGYARVVSEWVGFADHPSPMYRAKCRGWWAERFPGSDFPSDAAEAFGWVAEAPPMHYTPSEVATLPDGQYTRLAGVRWPAERGAWLHPSMSLPRACWTCRHFTADETCNMADPTADTNVPPEWIQPVGCDDYQLMQDADDFAATMRSDDAQAASIFRRIMV